MREDQTGLHQLLPWHVSGTLEPEEARAFEIHLGTCLPCSRDIGPLRQMQEAIERHGEAFFQPHPGPDRIVAEAFDRLPPSEAGEIRAHLLLCSTCALESRLAREGRDGAAAAAPTARHRLLRWKVMLPWLAAAAVLVSIGLPLWRQRAPGGGPTGIVQAYYVEPAQRAPGPAVLRLPPSAEAFQIVLPVDLGPGELPVAVSIHDHAGRIVFARDGVTEIYLDSFLFVSCNREDFPDGDYVVRVQPAPGPGGAPPPPMEFRFRVTDV
jgi:hypothetical protein